MTFTYDQVREASIRYFLGDELAGEVFAGKYALQDLSGVYHELTPLDMHKRLAREFFRIESKYPNAVSEDKILELFSSWKVVPQGSPMAGIGNPFQVQSVSNCFVIASAEDSYGGIFRADQEQAQIMKRRGGVGHDISNIRPKGIITANAARTTDGIAVFMDRYSNTTREVAQNGRRGALMLTISVHHPEIETFINIKKDKKRVTGANVSIRVSDEFMNAVKEKRNYEQRWPVDSNNPKIKKQVSAEKIWDMMMEAAWDSAEPGVLFWDTIINGSPADCYADVGYRTISTNPCGELPIPKYDSCRLMLMNILKYVMNPYTKDAKFNESEFYRDAVIAQRLMDDLIDLELEMVDRILEKIKNDPEPDEVKRQETELWNKIKATTASARRTGLGVTALADAIASLGFKYGSDESISFTSLAYRTLAQASYSSSVTMAEERGAFPVFDFNKEKDHPFVSKLLSTNEHLYNRWKKFGRRNIANLTTSPAGSVSVETQTTSGCEPAFLIDYNRRKKINESDKNARVDLVDESGDRWQQYKVYHHGHKKWAEVNGKDPDKDLTDSPYYGSTSADIDWVKKVELQAAAQEWIDHSISNTTNVPKDTSVDVIKQIYMKGWETGCKGITIYREGSRMGVLVSDNETKKQERQSNEIQESHAPKRPEILPCDIHLANVKDTQYIILVGLLEGRPYELFCGLSKNLSDLDKHVKSGSLVKVSYKNSPATYNLVLNWEDGAKHESTYEDIVQLFDNDSYGAMTRLLSTSLRHGVPVQYIVEQLKKDKHSDMWSFSSVIARILSKKYISDGTKTSLKKCPECESTNLSYQQGCVACLDCGNSKCS